MTMFLQSELLLLLANQMQTKCTYALHCEMNRAGRLVSGMMLIRKFLTAR